MAHQGGEKQPSSLSGSKTPLPLWGEACLPSKEATKRIQICFFLLVSESLNNGRCGGNWRKRPLTAPPPCWITKSHGVVEGPPRNRWWMKQLTRYNGACFYEAGTRLGQHIGGWSSAKEGGVVLGAACSREGSRVFMSLFHSQESLGFSGSLVLFKGSR